MRKMPIFFVILIVLLLVVVIAKDQIIKSAFITAAAQITGAKVSIDKFSLGVFKQSVRIEGFKMYNPQGFSNSVLVDLPKIAVDCNLPSLLKGKLHLKLLEIELKEITLEKNKEGKMNVDSLKVTEQKEAKSEDKKKSPQQLPLQIDVLNLQMERLVLKEYTLSQAPQVKVYTIGLKKSYKDITNAQQLAALILAEPMKQAGIQGAKIYTAALLTGVGVIPITIASKFIGKNSLKQKFEVAIDKLYEVSLEVLKVSGKIVHEDKSAKTIVADCQGIKVTLKLKELSSRSTEITASARNLMMPKPEIASGIMYQISEKLK